MRESADVRAALLRFYERRSAADGHAFDEVVSPELVLTVGTGPGERFADREQIKGHFATPGVRIDPGDPVAYEEGDVGWAFDVPTMSFPPVEGVPVRLSAVFHRRDGAWKVVHLHFSVAVPDEQIDSLGS